MSETRAELLEMLGDSEEALDRASSRLKKVGAQFALDKAALLDYDAQRPEERAAAPELLEAATRVVAYVVAGGEPLSPLFETLRAAIAKAKEGS